MRRWPRPWARKARPDVVEELPRPLVERGSFAHGVCISCGWEGPGRRARSAALTDAELHGMAGCPPAALPESVPAVPAVDAPSSQPERV
ncbi:hypothetical protein [Agilicoccus flavus]|uniref:hypothetical protein n=1 Tax=Agilicoccus flavus TaxID=2775968 RepID=UPI001CF6DF6C|nr:hypothetical protein [Agilicoccus flavus]